MKEEATEKKGHFFINALIFMLVIILGLYLYARYLEPSKLVVKEYRISSEDIPVNFSGIKIVHISDIYFGNTTDINNIDTMVEKINNLKPDLIFFTGNLFGNYIKNVDKLELSLNKLESTLGKYAIKGNNDYADEFESFMDKIDFKILKNEYELIYNEGLTPIFLCGFNSSLKEPLNIESCFKYFEDLEENPYNPSYKIIMVNEGDASKEILNSEIDVDLILAGNSLNGTIDLPYYGPVVLPKGSKEFFGEHYKRKNTDIFVSSGIGTNEYPYRLFNPPSINFYRLKSLQ